MLTPITPAITRCDSQIGLDMETVAAAPVVHTEWLEREELAAVNYTHEDGYLRDVGNMLYDSFYQDLSQEVGDSDNDLVIENDIPF